jgi:hypothetical protein
LGRSPNAPMLTAGARSEDVSKRRMASDRDGFGSSIRICGGLAAGALEAQVGG